VVIIMKNSFLLTVFLTILCFIGLIMGQQPIVVDAQPRITDTPLPVVIPENTAQPTSMTLLTPTPTFTMTPDAPQVVLQAAVPAADINVRDFPDVTGARLGSLMPEQQYPVTGVYFQWYQFEYANSPTGRAWVFADLVEIIGDQTAIPVVDPNVQPTAESLEEIGTATAQAQLLTPEFAESATAAARVLTIPPEEQSSGDGFLPTYTPPPDLAALQPTIAPDTLTTTPQGQNLASQVLTGLNTAVPPIVPIIGLISIGVLGLLIAIARR
jgi:hypothetical protein